MRTCFRVVLSAMVAVVFALGAATVASASTAGDRSDYQQLATSYQNSVIEQMMSMHTGGVRTAADTVVWNGGKVTLHVPASSTTEDTNQCGSADFCTWTGTSFSGTMVDCSGQGVWCSITSLPTASFQNNTPFRVWLQQLKSHTFGGTEVCTNSGNFALDFTGSPNSSDPWAWLSTNPATCP